MAIALLDCYSQYQACAILPFCHGLTFGAGSESLGVKLKLKWLKKNPFLKQICRKNYREQLVLKLYGKLHDLYRVLIPGHVKNWNKTETLNSYEKLGMILSLSCLSFSLTEALGNRFSAHGQSTVPCYAGQSWTHFSLFLTSGLIYSTSPPQLDVHDTPSFQGSQHQD